MPLICPDRWGWVSHLIGPSWLTSVNLITVGVFSIRPMDDPVTHHFSSSLAQSLSLPPSFSCFLLASDSNGTVWNQTTDGAFRVFLNKRNYAKLKRLFELLFSCPWSHRLVITRQSKHSRRNNKCFQILHPCSLGVQSFAVKSSLQLNAHFRSRNESS